MAPTEPDRDESFYTVEGQSQVIGVALTEHQAGIRLPHVILDDDGSVVGRATLNEIVRGPLQSASLGYYVDGRRNGRGRAGVSSLFDLCRPGCRRGAAKRAGDIGQYA